MKVKAISNFADGSHKQGDVFEVSDDEAKRLIEVEAVEATDEEAETQPEESTADEGAPATEAPLETTPPASESEATPPAAETLETPPAGHQPTEEELAQTIQDVETPPSSGDSVQVHIS